MKTKTIGFWTIAALTYDPVRGTAGLGRAFSASLGENDASINSAGSGAFQMEIGNTITFSLTFSGLSSPLAVAHLRFAPTKVAGGVMIFLCGGGGQPACPAATSGTITGTITAANVTGPTDQGITASNLDAALEACAQDICTCTRRTSARARVAVRCAGARDMAMVINDREESATGRVAW
jgi:hypothetical protein